jgi:predicted AAA+ superfamily ATPase
MFMFTRTKYLDSLIEAKDLNLIKVITGVRRCGKSTILEQFARRLRKTGANVIHINFERRQAIRLLDAVALEGHLYSKMDTKRMNYVMLDEIQNVGGFERLIDALFVERNVDLYLTGSNARFLSSDLATLLSGRYIEKRVFPYTFREFKAANTRVFKTLDDTGIFARYLEVGGFPEASNISAVSDKNLPLYLDSLFDTIVVKDTIERNGIQNVPSFKNLVRFVMDNIGSEVSPNSIANNLRRINQAMSKDTVQRYLAYLCDSFILGEARRYDIKGKRLLDTISKYYSVDVGLRQNILRRRSPDDIGHLIENVVFNELVATGAEVYVGKAYDREVDFLVRQANGERRYYQVVTSMRDASIRDRELSSLKRIHDGYPKTILTLDFEEGDYDGIRQINLINWLLT